MSFLLSLLSEMRYVLSLEGVSGWLAWLGFLAGVIFLAWYWRGYNRPWNGQRWALFGVLLVLTIPTTLFLGVRLSAASAPLPLPGIALSLDTPALMFFAALPWLMAAGLLGPLPAAILASLSGVLLTNWDTHTLFTPLELALLALLLGAAFQQVYRTPFYRLQRHPLFAALMATLIYPVFFLFDSLFVVTGPLPTRLDFAITRVGGATLAIAGELLVAALFAEAVALTLPGLWGGQDEPIPSPSERSLPARFLYSIGPIFLFLVMVLMVGDWYVAGTAAQDLLKQRMENTAQLAAESVPFFLETGQSLIRQIAADEELITGTPEEVQANLEEHIRTVPYFSQLFVLDADENPVAGYPILNYNSLFPTPEELVGVGLALQGVVFQSYSVPAREGGSAALLSFISALQDETGQVRGVLLGRSDLSANPFTQPVITNLNSILALDGEGILLDENGYILYHPDSDQVMTRYSGVIGGETAEFYSDIAADGTRRLVQYQPVIGRDWAILVKVPAQQAQQLSLTIAVPLLGMVLVFSAAALAVLQIGLRTVTRSLKNLAGEVDDLAQGHLDHPITVFGEDEVGQLARASELMRVNLKARLDELNRLLLVSQGVASSLEMESSVRPILEAALTTGAHSARVALAAAATPGLASEAPSVYSLGPAGDRYRNLDAQILPLAEEQDRIALTNPSRARTLIFDPDTPPPEALLALALRHENLFYGVLWVAYDQPHNFTDEEVRFLTTVAGQAALAAANTRLFLNAEIGRQRLAAILASTPDPVLVTDQQNRLLLANPAAWEVFSRMDVDLVEGLPVEENIPQAELVEMLRASDIELQSAEITMGDNRVYFAMASSVIAEGQRVGRVCVLREITRFKELDTLKSDFVATVSHDLRSPLTLMRGYATMLEMVGELNEQQIGYIRKIVDGVESMSGMVNNLLDLGRLEAGIGLQVEKVPVIDTVQQVVETLRIQATQKRIDLSTEIPSNTVPMIEADLPLLKQALQNLVDNALKYTESGGKVQVRLSTRPDSLLFEVRDTGIGIAPVDQARLFEKFYRSAGRKTRRQRGSGLGLAIVKSIAERHGGRVWVESRLGQGSNFSMLIPLRQPILETEG